MVVVRVLMWKLVIIRNMCDGLVVLFNWCMCWW